MTDKLVDRLREATLYEAHGEASSLPESAADALEAQQARIVELNQELYHPEQIYANLLAVVTDIRGQSGVGAKPMLSELAQAVGDRIRALEEALRPFAAVGDLLDIETEGVDDSDELQLLLHDYLAERFTAYLFRRAKQVLEGAGADTGWPPGTRVRKKSGSWWEGCVVGRYSTEQTPDGYCVQLERPHGPVQIYPASALEAVDDR